MCVRTYSEQRESHPINPKGPCVDRRTSALFSPTWTGEDRRRKDARVHTNGTPLIIDADDHLPSAYTISLHSSFQPSTNILPRLAFTFIHLLLP